MISRIFMLRMISDLTVMTPCWRWHQKGVCLGHIGLKVMLHLAIAKDLSNS